MSALRIKQLTEQRLKLVADARAIMNAVGTAKRAMTAEEAANFDKAMADADTVKTELDALHTEEQRRLRLVGHESELDRDRGRRTDPGEPERRGRDDPGRQRGGRTGDGGESRRGDGGESVIEIPVGGGRTLRFDPERAENRDLARRCGDDYIEAFRAYLAPQVERRALQADLDSAGGYMVAPETMVGQLLMDLDDPTLVRGLSRKFTITGQSLGVVTRQTKMASAAWGQELTSPTADTALTFGKRALMPHYQTASILVSRDLLRSSVMDPERIVLDELARDTGELEEQAFIAGNGAQKPLGLFTASTDGIDTSRDVSTDNTTTAITMDGLINAIHHLKSPYQANAKWMFHRTAVRNIRKLKDTAGQYIWQPADKPNTPDTLLGRPLIQSEWVPSTFTTGLYVGIVGDFDYYWIVDQLMMDLQRLVETNARTNQVEFIVRRKVDGAPVRAEAFARVKLA
ncbi:MAG: phage major capsid protein [Phycisphaerales bacterium]